MGSSMKAFWVGSALAVIIAIAAGVVLNANSVSTQAKYSTSNTNL